MQAQIGLSSSSIIQSLLTELYLSCLEKSKSSILGAVPTIASVGCITSVEEMVLTHFDGIGVGFGFGVGCGFGVGWGFGGMPLNVFGLGAGGGCGIGLGLGWGFGTAFGSQYRSSRVTFQGTEFSRKDKSVSKESKALLRSAGEGGESQ